jgi:hypothetical protein
VWYGQEQACAWSRNYARALTGLVAVPAGWRRADRLETVADLSTSESALDRVSLRDGRWTRRPQFGPQRAAMVPGTRSLAEVLSQRVAAGRVGVNGTPLSPPF